jgi:hypothetical protein
MNFSEKSAVKLAPATATQPAWKVGIWPISSDFGGRPLAFAGNFAC